MERSPMEQAIFKVVREALIKHRGNRSAAARELGITVRTIYNYCQKWEDLKVYVKDYGRLERIGNDKWRRYHDNEE